MSGRAEQIRTLRIRGMFCTHCEETIRRALTALPGVLSAEVSWEREQAVVRYDPARTDERAMAACIEAAGYEVAASAPWQKLLVLLLLLALWMTARCTGLTQIFSFFPRAEASLSIGALFVTGLLTSVHCIAMCGGINLTQSVMASAGKRSLLRSNALYQAGRMLSYTAVGAIAGGIGSALSVNSTVKGIIALLAGLAMLVMALNMLGAFRPLRRLHLRLPAGAYAALSRRAGSGSSFVIGLLNGLMPCGPLQAMQIYALSSGSIARGALSMLVFGLGTVPLMLGFGLISGRLNRKYSRIMLTVSAMVILIMGLNMCGNGLALAGVALPQRGTDAAAASTQAEAVQHVTAEIDYGRYPTIRVHAGTPVEWELVVPEGKLNGCNGEILIPAYGLDVVLHEGSNRITFSPEETGTFPYTCWMGMIQGTIEVVD